MQVSQVPKGKKIKVLWEDKNLMVLDKPAGVAVHGDGKGTLMSQTKGAAVPSLKGRVREGIKKEETIADYILKTYKKIKGVGEDMVAGSGAVIERPGIVHRLDKDTSGCLVICKNEDSFQNLKKQFSQHTIRKEYVAVVWGHIPFETGLINLPIARSKNDFRKKEVVKAVGLVQGAAQSATAGFRTLWRGEERDAVTRYKVVKRIEKFGEKLTIVIFLPETGRTHQIRVHAKSIGHPIVADNLYGPRSSKSEKLEFKIFKTKDKKKIRHLLHAKSISFLNPTTSEVVKVESKLPKEFDMK